MTASATPLFCSATAATVPGAWKLVPGRALTLRPATDGILRVAHGRLWATVDGPHGRTPDDSGDHVLQAGRSLYVRAGQGVVIEGWNADGASYFAWDPVFAPAIAARSRLNAALVLQPLADLRMALALAARAAGHLARGVAQLAWHALGGRRAPVRRRRPGLVG